MPFRHWRLAFGKKSPALKGGAFAFPADLGLSPVSGFSFNDRQFCGRLTYSQSPDVPGSVPIGVRGETAVLAQELALALAIGFLTMPAPGASTAGVARVNLHDRDTRVLRLIHKEAVELVERPT